MLSSAWGAPSRLGLWQPLWNEIFNPWVATVPREKAQFWFFSGKPGLVLRPRRFHAGPASGRLVQASCGLLPALGSEVHLGALTSLSVLYRAITLLGVRAELSGSAGHYPTQNEAEKDIPSCSQECPDMASGAGP